jgi:hypothetical protein
MLFSKYLGYNITMFNLPNAKIDRMCPDCRRPLVELSKFAAVLDNDAMLRDNFSTPFGYAGRTMLILELIDIMINNIAWTFRRQKIINIINKTLPDYPHAEICANCLFILRVPHN